MRLVSYETVQLTCRDLTTASPEEGLILQERFLEQQGPLVTFVLVTGEQGMSDKGRELALYLALNVWQMFDRESSQTLEQVSAEEIMAAYDNREAWIESFMDADDEEISRWLSIVTEIPQEHVARYVVEALMEDPDTPYSNIGLTEEDIGHLFWMLLSVIDVFDEKLQESER